MRVLMVEPGKSPYETNLKGDLKSMQEFLQAHQIYYGTYYHSTVGVLVNNIVTHLDKINSSAQQTTVQPTEFPAQDFNGLETPAAEAAESVAETIFMGM